MTEMILTVLWGLGWFVTVALSAAVFLGIVPREEWEEDSGVIFAMVPVVLIVMVMIWPGVLAVLIGRFLAPYVKALVDREKHLSF